MSEAELKALEALTFNWTSALEDVWSASPFHVEGLHPEAARLIRQGIREAEAGAQRRPLGLPLQGERGVGKTHLLGWAREQVQGDGGYFFLLGDLTRKTFWEEARSSFVQQLLPLPDGSRNQIGRLLGDLADRAGLDKPARDALTGDEAPSVADVKAFVAALRKLNSALPPPSLDTARALVLLASPHGEQQETGYYYLVGGDIDADERVRWGFRSRTKDARYVINQLSEILALSGPAVVAVDQIDALIDHVNKHEDASAVAEVATGLMSLRDTTRRTFTIISCLPESWAYVRNQAVATVEDRFRPPCQIQNIPTADIGRRMIEKRFAADFARAGFEPPYPTWPIRPRAFEDATSYTARRLLRRIDEHVTMCLRARQIYELDRLDEGIPVADGQAQADVQSGGAPPAQAEPEAGLAALDARFDELWRSADVSAALVTGTEDSLVPSLLQAGLEAWVRERGGVGDQSFVQERLPGRNPPLHADLRMIIDERTERQRRWAFRAIAATNARTVQSRLKNAVEAAGLDEGSADRMLFVLRSIPWPSGSKTSEDVAEFSAKGGRKLTLTASDLQVFDALTAMLAERDPALNAWLASRQPAHRTELLSSALGDLARPDRPAPSSAPAVSTPSPQRPQPDMRGSDEVAPGPASPEPGPDAIRGPVGGGSFRIGATIPGQRPVSLDLAVLRRHAVLFAGSGSGKTVLLRRIIEECALQGVSAIVLDPNNDLARLGDGWPEPPPSWSAEDADRARDYLDNTDVVIWTPRRQSGRPLTFRPLPEFAEVVDDPDDFDAAIDAAVGAIAPRLVAGKGPVKAAEEVAVLREALRYFASAGASDFDGFVALLDELPGGASSLRKASETAADLAQRLQVIRINDPLFAGEGEPADPGMLLTPPPGKRARVSVISMIGLPDIAQRQGFVNQLQMALFSWIKRHPAADRPLSGLLVMDEAQDLAPSGQVTACTESTLRLVSQARKYGLGLLFATQAPKALHNRIPGNATTQFYGLLSSPAQIDAAREVARAKGGDVPDIGRLRAGQFYIGTEGTSFVKAATPMCLSYHPEGPLTEEEVVIRARQGTRRSPDGLQLRHD
jgi:Helicase HerA, central domain